jgi:hypothetical protein
MACVSLIVAETTNLLGHPERLRGCASHLQLVYATHWPHCPGAGASLIGLGCGKQSRVYIDLRSRNKVKPLWLRLRVIVHSAADRTTGVLLNPSSTLPLPHKTHVQAHLQIYALAVVFQQGLLLHLRRPSIAGGLDVSRHRLPRNAACMSLLPVQGHLFVSHPVNFCIQPDKSSSRDKLTSTSEHSRFTIPPALPPHDIQNQLGPHCVVPGY